MRGRLGTPMQLSVATRGLAGGLAPISDAEEPGTPATPGMRSQLLGSGGDAPNRRALTVGAEDPSPVSRLRGLKALADGGDKGTPRSRARRLRSPTGSAGEEGTPRSRARRLRTESGSTGDEGTPRSRARKLRSPKGEDGTPRSRRRRLRTESGDSISSATSSPRSPAGGGRRSPARRTFRIAAKKVAKKAPVARFRDAARRLQITQRLQMVSHVPAVVLEREAEAAEAAAAEAGPPQDGGMDLIALAKLRARAKKLADKAKMNRRQRAAFQDQMRGKLREAFVEGQCSWFRQRLEQRAADARMWMRFGLFLYREERWAEAGHKFKIAAKLGHRTGELYWKLAQSLIREWRSTLVPSLPRGAALALQMAARPCWGLVDQPRYWVFLAFVHEASGSFQGALAVRSQMIERFPELPETRLEIYRAAVLLKHCGDYRQAKDYLDHIITTPPPPLGEEDVSFDIAHILQLQGKEGQAAILFAEIFNIRRDLGTVGEHATWQQWYTSPLPWQQALAQAQKLDTWHAVLDHSKEVLKRTTVAHTTDFFVSLAEGHMRVGDVEAGVEAMAVALEMDHFNEELRARISAWDPEGWGARLAFELKAFVMVQSAMRGRRCRLIFEEWKKVEVERALKAYAKDMYDRDVRHFLSVFLWKKYRPLFKFQEEQARVLQRNLRVFATRNKRWRQTAQALARRCATAETAFRAQPWDAAVREQLAAVMPDKYALRFARETRLAIVITRNVRGYLVRRRTGRVRVKRTVKTKLQSAVKSVGLLSRMKQFTSRRDVLEADAASRIKRAYRRCRACRYMLRRAEEIRRELMRQRLIRHRLGIIRRKMAARTVQRFYHYIRRWYQRAKFAVRVQAAVRGFLGRLELRRRRAQRRLFLLVRLQAHVRGSLTRTRVRRWLAAGAADYESPPLLLPEHDRDVAPGELEALAVRVREGGVKLATLGLARCRGVSAAGVAAVVDAVRATGHPLEVFALQDCGAGDAAALAASWLLGDYFFGRFARLHTLSLRNEGLTDASGLELARTMDLSHSLQVFRLDGNALTAKTALRVAAALPRCRRLAELDLSDNVVNTEGLVALAAAALQCPTLVRLRVANNYGTVGIARPLLRAVVANPRFQELAVAGNAVAPSLQSRIDGVLAGHRAAEAAAADKAKRNAVRLAVQPSARHGHMRCYTVAGAAGFDATTPQLREVNTGEALAHVRSRQEAEAEEEERPADFGSAKPGRPLPKPEGLPIALPVPLPSTKPGERPLSPAPSSVSTQSRGAGSSRPGSSSTVGLWSSRPGTAASAASASASRSSRPGSSSTVGMRSRPGTGYRRSSRMTRDRPPSAYALYDGYQEPGESERRLERFRVASAAGASPEMRPAGVFKRPATAAPAPVVVAPSAVDLLPLSSSAAAPASPAAEDGLGAVGRRRRRPRSSAPGTRVPRLLKSAVPQSGGSSGGSAGGSSGVSSGARPRSSGVSARPRSSSSSSGVSLGARPQSSTGAPSPLRRPQSSSSAAAARLRPLSSTPVRRRGPRPRSRDPAHESPSTDWGDMFAPAAAAPAANLARPKPGMPLVVLDVPGRRRRVS